MDPSCSKRDKTHIHNNQEYEASAQFMHVRQSDSVSFTTVLVFHQEKNCDLLGLYTAQNGNSYRHCPA